LHLGRAPLQLIWGVSRKVHGDAGAFDIPLTLDGTVTVECRRENLFLSHELVFTFSDTLTSGSASIPRGNGISLTEIRGDELHVRLFGVRDGETVNVTLNHVSNGKSVLPPIEVKVGFLFGDVAGSGLVDQTDVNEVRSDSLDGGELNTETFRADILLNGKVDQRDIFFDNLRVGHRLN
jgi:hypothetical protein